MKKYLSIVLFAILIGGCKPTEKNYEAAYSKAYEVARMKAEAEQTADDGTLLESIDGPHVEAIGSDSIMVGQSRIKPFEGDTGVEKGRYGIAVAKYSMPTNARRHLQDLKKEYPDAFIATDGKDGYYVLIKRVAEVPEAADPIRVYRMSHPNDSYMGLQGQPALYFVTQ